MKRLTLSLHNRALYTIPFFFLFLTILFAVSSATAQDILISGELMRWHPVTLTIEGPTAEEEDTVNPFLDYRLEVTFTQGSTSITVPGYFAADGDAAETGATSGSKWRAHFVPRTTGDWNYVVSMRTGNDVAIDASPQAGEPTPQDGLSGSFSIAETNKTGRDFRGKGVLSYANGPYLQFDNGDYFIKGGADSPENFLGYFEFDNTKDHGCQNNTLQDGLHRYEAHVSDWKQGDPVWHTDKGKGIIGALNYLSSKGINSVYFLPMNTEGDGCEVYPWTEYGSNASERLHYDVSKLDQWNIVFDHMDAFGLMLHIVTQEQENDQLLDGGALGTERKLYYRELMARFGHHLAITWNLGEENTNTHNQRIEFADYLSSLDPYNHLVVVHTFPNQIGNIYDDLLGYPNDSPVQNITGNSIQRDLDNNIHEEVIKWRNRSDEMNHPWVVMLDEIGPAGTGAKPDGSGNNHKEIREEALWATLMAGGAGTSATSQSYTYTDDTLPTGADILLYRLKQVDFDGTFSYSDPIELRPTVPTEVVLNPNYPNPFNPVTTLSFSLPVESQVRLTIYDTTGRLITTLLDNIVPAGNHNISYKASSDLASGTYIYRLETQQFTRSGKMMLLK